jgi:hypothetical protein
MLAVSQASRYHSNSTPRSYSHIADVKAIDSFVNSLACRDSFSMHNEWTWSFICQRIGATLKTASERGDDACSFSIQCEPHELNGAVRISVVSGDLYEFQLSAVIPGSYGVTFDNKTTHENVTKAQIAMLCMPTNGIRVV